jgi:hypothetical protein
MFGGDVVTRKRSLRGQIAICKTVASSLPPNQRASIPAARSKGRHRPDRRRRATVTKVRFANEILRSYVVDSDPDSGMGRKLWRCGVPAVAVIPAGADALKLPSSRAPTNGRLYRTAPARGGQLEFRMRSRRRISVTVRPRARGTTPRPFQESIWHPGGMAPVSEGIYEAKTLRLTRLRMIPDQMYFNVEDSAPPSDALLTVKQMIFVELANIKQTARPDARRRHRSAHAVAPRSGYAEAQRK